MTHTNLHVVTLQTGPGKHYQAPTREQIMDNQRPAQAARETIRALDNTPADPQAIRDQARQDFINRMNGGGKQSQPMTGDQPFYSTPKPTNDESKAQAERDRVREEFQASRLDSARQDSQRVLDAAYAKRCERYGK